MPISANISQMGLAGNVDVFHPLIVLYPTSDFTINGSIAMVHYGCDPHFPCRPEPVCMGISPCIVPPDGNWAGSGVVRYL